jgi:tRNA A37 threonylcarbamoyladenosine dehydratase
VFSDERPIAPTSSRTTTAEGFQCVCPQGDNELHTCEKRARIDGSAAWVTGTFGLVAASVVAVRELRGESVIDRSSATPSAWSSRAARAPCR